MRWKKLGLIYSAPFICDELATHASNPLPLHLHDDIYRVYFSGRNRDNKSSVGFVDIDVKTRKVIKTCERPLLIYGSDGSFYSHGISIGNIYTVKSQQYILFMGWQIEEGQHWRGDIGRIRVLNEDSFVIEPDTAYIGIDKKFDKVSLSYPWVEENPDGSFDMWYGSTISWDSPNGEMVHVINHAKSLDGDSWVRNGLSIPYKEGIAQAFSRPTLLIDDGYKMWFSYRSGTGEKYRIGYAYSEHGKDWVLDIENSGISVGAPGSWDSEMICYPYVFKHKDEVFMLYNGNSNGKTGFGIAQLELNG